MEEEVIEYNGWTNPDTFHFYNWLTESEDRFMSVVDSESISSFREWTKAQHDLPNGIDLDEVNWVELWNELHND